VKLKSPRYQLDNDRYPMLWIMHVPGKRSHAYAIYWWILYINYLKILIIWVLLLVQYG